MSSSSHDVEGALANQAKVARLENFHRHNGPLLALALLGLLAFIGWAMVFRIDEVARASGEVIASNRVQVIQAVDGGVLVQLMVREGDRVKPGQVLARLDQGRLNATVGEVEARLMSLNAKAIRLRAEVTSSSQEPQFPSTKRPAFRDMVEVDIDLAQQELLMVEALLKSGDVSGTEVLRAKRAVNEAQARWINRKNKFLEDARIELTKAEDEIAQNSQVLTRHQQERQDSIFTAQVAGIVKNIRVTTVGGVLRAGEEIMQIVPVDVDLIIEAKISPADIARVHPGLPSNIRFDPFDYTVYGSVAGKVTYVSADTLKKDTAHGEETSYRVHVSPSSTPVVSSNGKTLEILPGMTAQIDIRTGDRSLMDYLLKPLRKTLSEALGER
jgi:adhesin transport system membrane fusion protein